MKPTIWEDIRTLGQLVHALEGEACDVEGRSEAIQQLCGDDDGAIRQVASDTAGAGYNLSWGLSRVRIIIERAGIAATPLDDKPARAKHGPFMRAGDAEVQS